MAFSINFIRFLTLAAVVKLPPVAAQTNEGFLTGSVKVVRRDRIVDQLRSLLGHGQGSERLDALEKKLRPTFMALPKDSSGSLEHRAARYALHRFFLMEHGWHIKGLSSEVPQNRTSPPAEILKSRMPSLIMQLLEEQMGSDRVGLEEFAVLAATIEDLVQSDASDLLHLAYKTHGLSTDEVLSAHLAGLVIRTFMFYFRMPWTLSLANKERYMKDLVTRGGEDTYPNLEDDMLWIEDVKQGLALQDRASLRPSYGVAEQHLDFSSVASWARAIVSGFGKFRALDCHETKGKLMDMEDHQDGRVPLAVYYGNSYDLWWGDDEDEEFNEENHEFNESPAYLRHLGALDEHNPRQPSVIVPNILYSMSNCIQDSGFFMICCINACEELMVDLEQQVSQSVASPALIATVVSMMPSETVAAPRTLPDSFRSRLDEIAGRHGGSVPLHSRLFAQWMHYAFPNECPYPRSLITSDVQLTHDEWVTKHNHTNGFATEEEMDEAWDLYGDDDEIGPLQHVWSEDEELLSDLLVVPEKGTLPCILLWLAGAAVSAPVVMAALRAFRAVRPETSGKHTSRPGLGRVGTALESGTNFV